jgi:hypothetical protein
LMSAAPFVAHTFRIWLIEGRRNKTQEDESTNRSALLCIVFSHLEGHDHVAGSSPCVSRCPGRVLPGWYELQRLPRSRQCGDWDALPMVHVREAQCWMVRRNDPPQRTVCRTSRSGISNLPAATGVVLEPCHLQRKGSVLSARFGALKRRIARYFASFCPEFCPRALMYMSQRPAGAG